jgi:hypothetical protein
MLCAPGGLNRCRFDLMAEHILLIFVPATTQNGDRKAFVTAHPLQKGIDFVSKTSTQSCVRGAFFRSLSELGHRNAELFCNWYHVTVNTVMSESPPTPCVYPRL